MHDIVHRESQLDVLTALPKPIAVHERRCAVLASNETAQHHEIVISVPDDMHRSLFGQLRRLIHLNVVEVLLTGVCEAPSNLSLFIAARSPLILSIGAQSGEYATAL